MTKLLPFSRGCFSHVSVAPKLLDRTSVVHWQTQLSKADARTRIVLLGTGTPVTDPDRSGPAIAIIVDEQPYLVDFGPGVVRRGAAAHRSGMPGLAVSKLTRAFVTHLHSDHTVGYPF